MDIQNSEPACLRVIFVTPKHGPFMRLVGALVTSTTASPYSHVAMELSGGLFESVFPQVMIAPPDKYTQKKCIAKETLILDLEPGELDKIKAKAFEILNSDQKYSIKGCIATFFATVFGIGAGKWVADNIGVDGYMCSELITTCIRAARPYLCGEMEAHLVSPGHLYSALRAEGAR